MSSVAGIVLAGGASKRLLRWTVEQACMALCDEIVVVVSSHDPSLLGFRASSLVNAHPEEGTASSIRCGITWAAERHYDSALLMVCDRAHLAYTHLNRLIRAQRKGRRVVTSRYSGMLGVPAIFDRSLFPWLGVLRGAQGACELIRMLPDAVALDWPEGAFEDTARDIADFTVGN